MYRGTGYVFEAEVAMVDVVWEFENWKTLGVCEQFEPRGEKKLQIISKLY